MIRLIRSDIIDFYLLGSSPCAFCRVGRQNEKKKSKISIFIFWTKMKFSPVGRSKKKNSVLQVATIPCVNLGARDPGTLEINQNSDVKQGSLC